MRTVYALLVGIDDYPDAPLRGCVNDVRAAEDWLRRRSGLTHEIRTLYDARATRVAVLAGIEDHLARSGPGDTALLWYSGHGSERPTDDPREATGWSQALVCHDSLAEGGLPLLQDTELGPLLDRIAARGTHVVAVLDCCHSGGATRNGVPGTTARGVDWRPWWPTGGSRGSGVPGGEPGRHVLLAACRPRERAHENVLDGQVRGYFSHALLDSLDRLGPTPAYGVLHARVQERVRSRMPTQHPELRALEDARFLHGDAVPSSPFLLRHTTGGWEVDCGHAHGLRAPGAEFTLLGEGAGARTVVVREVRAESSLVDPVDWRPGPAERELVHGVTPTALAFPPAAVTVTGDPDGVRLVSRAVAGVLSTAAGGDGLRLRVDVRDGLAWVSGGAGRPLPALPLRSDADAARVADCVAHLTHWHRVRDLVNPDPWLSSLVRIGVEETAVGRLRRLADGEIVCSYTADHRPPQVRVRVHNDSDRPLWCVLLDLTDSHGSSPDLYEGDFVGPGRAGWAMRGEPVGLYLPRGSAVVPGAATRDCLKLIVTENELNLAPFRLEPWSPGAPAYARDPLGTAGPGGLLRLAGREGDRDAGPVPGVGRWGTAQVVVRTEVP
ncbi:caspase family protein [Streptomyces sp. NPDC001595]|uniref:caspase family protein n=1 Tax=Streptomyces sp. NPDC001532 TaxID=3154520 RepID=UPI003323DFFC